jgi:hypothetical protein
MAMIRESVNAMETANQGIKRLLFCGFGVVGMGRALLGAVYIPSSQWRGWHTRRLFELATESRTLC